MKNSVVEIVPYSSSWPARYEQEREILLEIFAREETNIEHIGSTSVEGLDAKPVIDILLGVGDLSQVENKLPSLIQVGYLYMPEYESELPERRFFVKPPAHPRQYHLHVVLAGGTFWQEHLLFRDALRADKNLTSAYLSLKRELAARFFDNRDSYTDGKSRFIAEVIGNPAGG